MRLSRVSSIIFTIVFTLTLLSACRTCITYIYLRNSIITKNKILETAKTGTSDVQDDFRGEKFGLLKKYTKEHAKRSIDGSHNFLTDNDRKVILSRYGLSSYSDKAGIFIKRHEGRVLKNEHIYKAYSNNNERIYFYVVNNVYHSSNCPKLANHYGKREIYSSMEDCALNGANPCIKCILGYN